jgi:putative heme-binding domain-containing protein
MIRRSRFAGLFVALAAASATLPVAHSQDKEGKLFTQDPEILAVEGQAAPPAKTPADRKASPFKEGPAPSWIWGADPNTKYVVRTKFAGGAKTATLRASCDNVMTVRLNGTKVASSSEWQKPVEIDVTKQLKAGENVLEADIANEGGPSGFILKLVLTGADGKATYVVSDDRWEVATASDSKEWAKAKVVAKSGGGAWAGVFDSEPGADVAVTEKFRLPKGFQIERLFTVPKEKLGSWVNITVDKKGRLIVSDQGNLGLCRITPPAIGSKEPTKVEKLDVKMSGAQGLLFAFDSLYVCANWSAGNGLYRLRDTDGDDQFDEVTKLKDLRGGGEHGPHAVRLSPDGKSIYLCAGNHTLPPFDRKLNAPVQTMGGPRTEQLKAELPEGNTSRILPNWDEDTLLPRQWDANGHATGILAPGGWIAKTDPDGKTWEMVSVGYRNQFDFAFNADGEMFAYDSDMEWDMGAPWYRPTRVTHATSGSDFGWRSGTSNPPAYYYDSLPPMLDIGPGSPVGVDFGYGAKFPATYQKALFICDWTFGTMYAVHTKPDGSTYSATKEEFVARAPLPLTDVTISPADGAMYFTIGGRGAQSELFRVTYVGDESTAPVKTHDEAGADLRKLRHEIEAFHVEHVASTEKAVAFLVPHLGHADRFIRFAARIALERIPTDLWADKVLASKDAESLLTGVCALAHAAEPSLEGKILEALGKLDYAKLTDAQQLEYLRAYQLVFIRLGAPDEATQAKLGPKFDALFPGATDYHNRELAILMVFLQSPGAAKKIVPLLTKERSVTAQDLGEVLARNKGYAGAIQTMLANHPDMQQIHYAFVLRNLKKGWTPAERKTYFEWYGKARTWAGGNSYQKFLTNMDNDAFANSTDAERLAIEATGSRKPYIAPELPKPAGPGKDWTLDEVRELAATKLSGRDYKNGEKTYKSSRCVVCHRFAGDGGATGPDLTQLAGRFNVKDLTEAIIDPSKVISDQYKATIVQTADGKSVTGRIVTEAPDSITLVVDPEQSTKILTIKKSDIEEQKPSSVSLMPKDLLKTLNQDEVLDLLAYLLSRGDPGHAVFRK